MSLVNKIIILYDKNEVKLSIDNVEYLISYNDYCDLYIKNNEVISDDLFEKILTLSESYNCLKKSFKYLSYSNLSKKQLFRKLKPDFSENIIYSVLDKLIDKGYINDADNAFRYAELYFQRKLFGSKRIKSELYHRGFEQNDIQNAIEELDFNSEQIDENIRFLINKKFKTNIINKNNRPKVYTYLINMGYSSSEISHVINEDTVDDE